MSPTHAISVDGELMPKKPVMPSQMSEHQLVTLSQSQPASDWMPFHKPRTRSLPAEAIWPTP